MAAPFYNAIKGTTSGAPGTSAFTPNAAASGYRAWSNVPTGWTGLVRYEDGSSWELTYSYWNGTTLSRASTQLYDSSSGSAISLTSAATAAFVLDPAEVMSHLGTTPWSCIVPQAGTTSANNVGMIAQSAVGTAAAASLATTNFLTEQRRIQYTSATTPAGSAAGWTWSAAQSVYSTSAGHCGGEFVARFGASTLPTGPRLVVGMLSATGSNDPSSWVANIAAFAKDEGDTNIQLLVNNASGGGTKTDTGIPLVANGWYEANVWWEPGGGRIYGLLIRLDTGAIWLGSTTTDIPVNGALMFPYVWASLGTTTGTAIVFHIGQMALRGGE